ncbi:MAG: phosphomannomutase/phosphoglucomutase [Gammaproteobacteria bacterium]
MQLTALFGRRWYAGIRVLNRWRMILLSFAVLLLLTVLISAAYQRYSAWSERQHLEIAEATVQRVATELGAHLQDVWSFARPLGDSNEATHLLIAGDRDAIAAWENLLREQYPQVRLARLLPLGSRRVDYSSNPPLSYAALDMLPQTEQSAAATPPTLLLGGESQHLAIAQPVTSATGKVLGHLFLALDVSLLNHRLTDFVFPSGYWEVRQPVGDGGYRVVHSLGKPSSTATQPPLHVNIPDTGWFIAFWHPPSGKLAAGFPSTIAIWGVAGTIGLLLAFYLAFYNQRQAKAPLTDPTALPAEEALDGQAAILSDHPLSRSMHAIPPSAEAMTESSAAPEPSAPGVEISEQESPAASSAPSLPAAIFRAYDVRGLVGETLTAEIVLVLGRAIGSEARAQGQHTVVVGHDARLSSTELQAALVQGLLATGCDVVNVGRVPTPVVYFATHYLQTGNGVIVTGSHNPPAYNGLKIMIDGQILSGERITRLRHRVETGELIEGAGHLQSIEVVDEYVRAISDEVPVALGNAFQIVVDCGNGVAGEIAPKLYRALGHDVVELHCEIDGRFPHHHPDPSQPDNLQELIQTVLTTGADLGFAFDGDGDRLGVVDSRGTIIWPDQQMMLFAQDILAQNPGAPVVYDVKCSHHLKRLVEQYGGQPIMWKSGHSYIRNKMQETGALLAGELTGHLFFGDRWYGFDDAFYAGARLLELLIASHEAPHEVFSKLPQSHSTPELRIDLAEGNQVELMSRLIASRPFSDAEVDSLDGLRVTYADGWGLVRASNTTPSLVLRFEADTPDALIRIQDLFKEQLLKLEPTLGIPF